VRPGVRLTTHEYDERLDEIADAFSGLYGEVTYGRVEEDHGTVRKLRVGVEVPGYGEPKIATLVFIEKQLCQARSGSVSSTCTTFTSSRGRAVATRTTRTTMSLIDIAPTRGRRDQITITRARPSTTSAGPHASSSK